MKALDTAKKLVDLNERLDQLREEIRVVLADVKPKTLENIHVLNALEQTGEAGINLVLAARALEVQALKGTVK